MAYGSVNVPGKLTAAQVGAAAADHTHTAEQIGASPSGHRHTKSEITDFPSSMPASDVPAWAKAASKPTYTASEVGALASGGTAEAAKKLATARTIRTKLNSTDAVSFSGTANVTPGVTGTLPITNGGTGSTTASGALANLGAAPVESPVFTKSISMGRKSGSVVGYLSVATGYDVEASADNAHAEGNSTVASGVVSHAEGNQSIARGNNSHAEGSATSASGKNSHAENEGTYAGGESSHAEGYHSDATGYCSHAQGMRTIASASYQTAMGAHNIESTDAGDKLIIGKGAAPTSRSNCFRVTHTGVYASGNYASTGADYAELFEWVDGNPDGADRCGRFVTLEGEKIRLAGPEDGFILGIISGNPSVVGDVYDDQWQGMYLYDIFGRPIWEDVEVPDETKEEPDPENPENTITRVIIPAHTERRQKLNPDYDNTQKYIPRTKRPEWGCVGMMGKLTVVDDGTCQVNGWCTVGEGGKATASEARTRYRVITRLDDNHVRVLVL